jgi:hypothetical protein
MRRPIALALALVGLAVLGQAAQGQGPKQPKVQPGPSEPDWVVILKNLYGLSMFDDLLNPVKTTPEAVPALFKKAGPGPVTYAPVIALGLPSVTRGGWYKPGPDAKSPGKEALWSYQFKNTTQDIETGKNLPPPMLDGSKTTFDPGETPFGLWVSNDNFPEETVYSQPSVVAALDPRFAKQPYKAMIYPNRDKATGKTIPHSYLIGWEYSTNDDFQDVVTRVDNVDLIGE